MRYVVSAVLCLLCVSAVSAQCANGRCPLQPAAQPALTWFKFPGDEKDYCQLGCYDPASKQFKPWHGAAGYGEWGALPRGVVPPARTIEQLPPTGVDAGKLKSGRVTINGQPAERHEAIAKLSNVPDLSNKWRLVVLGDEATRRAVLEKIGKPDTAVVNAYPADDWHVKQLGFDTGNVLYAMKPDGEVVGQASSVGQVDGVLSVTQTTPDKWRQPQPAPMPDPNASPSVPLPSGQHVTGAVAGIVITLLLQFGLPLLRNFLASRPSPVDDALTKILDAIQKGNAGGTK